MAFSAMSSTEGKGSCLLGFRSLSSDVETVLVVTRWGTI
jgi:hypothetical protein